MPAIRFIYSRGRGSFQIHRQTIDIKIDGEITHSSLRQAEAAFVEAFTAEFGDDYLIQWEAWSLDEKTRYSGYKAYLPAIPPHRSSR